MIVRYRSGTTIFVMPLRRVVALAPLLLSLAGCVLTEIPSGAPTEELRREQRAQAERVARALCAGYYACDCQDPYPEHDTEAECFEEVADEVAARLEQGIDRGLDYDPACLDAHAELLERVACTPSGQILLDVELWTLLDTAERCQTYHGVIDAGEECERLATSRGDDCEPDLVCNDFAICEATEILAEGEPCSGDTGACAAGLWCIEAWPTGQGTCMRLPAIGESCEATLGQCDFDGWCDSDQVCRPYASVGQACEGGGEFFDTCGGHEAHCTEGTCVAAPVEGEPCGQGCALGFSCGDDELCIRRRAAVCDMRESLP